MDIVRTKVFPKAERATATSVLQADLTAGKSVLFSLRDKREGSISGSQRLSKNLARAFPIIPASEGPSISNFRQEFSPLTESDIKACVEGFGRRFPCDHAYVLSVEDVDQYRSRLADPDEPLNQNDLLPGFCNCFGFSIFGVVAMAVRTLGQASAIAEIESDDPAEPFQTKSWSFVHLSLNDDERARARNISGTKELIEKRAALKRSVDSHQGASLAKASDAARVTLSPIAKRHFKKLGYSWNKAESQQRVTVFDKVTQRGNIIRITADAGGFNELIPYISAEFMGEILVSEKDDLVFPTRVSSESQLERLLDNHSKDVVYFETEIASVYDDALGRCNSVVTELMLRHRVRRIG